jgi:ferritin-like metal-binding protein YciE
MKITSIEQTLTEELKDLYDAEKQLVKALPKMAKLASSPSLKEAIEAHLQETKGHVDRLGEVFAALGVKASSKPCAAMKGLIQEGSEVGDTDAGDEYRDELLIGAAQRVEHYEMAAYGTARALAEYLGNEEAVSLLQQTLDEERAADEKLTDVAQEILEGLEEGAGIGGGKTRRAGGSSE